MNPSRPLVMGVLNLTPDSFSDGGAHLAPEDAVRRAAEMFDDGVDILDLGGESTRPGATPVPPDEECERVLPALELVVPLARAAGVRVSIDTRHEATARAAVAAGAELINDVSSSLWPVAAELGVGWVAVHAQGEPATMQDAPYYDDVVEEVRRELISAAMSARDAGVGEVWVDPGIGFGKTTAHNLELLARLDVLVAEGFPVLVGTSRKRFTGELVAASDSGVRVVANEAVEVAPVAVEERRDASLATATWAMVLGAAGVRVHDVAVSRAAATVVGGDFPTP